jgi:hypothetical protein
MNAMDTEAIATDSLDRKMKTSLSLPLFMHLKIWK